MNDIFLCIEKKMNGVIPAYMKNILKSCGYDNCHTIATIEDADIDYFIDEVRKGNVNSFYKGKISEENIMERCATGSTSLRTLCSVVDTLSYCRQ